VIVDFVHLSFAVLCCPCGE